MQKLKLNLDDLQVHSFATERATAPRAGTVHAREGDSIPSYTCPFTWTWIAPGCVTPPQTDNESECFPTNCA